jgi:hypothetical protein
MGHWHGYFGIEVGGMTGAQKAKLMAALRTLGPSRADTDWPPYLLHFRMRPDTNVGVFEARFNEEHLTVATLKQFLANAFGVPTATLESTNTSVLLNRLPSPIVSVRYGGIDRLRIILFGGMGAAWADSREECAAYLTVWERAQPWPASAGFIRDQVGEVV